MVMTLLTNLQPRAEQSASVAEIFSMRISAAQG
jgi:hypothetical protein